MYKVNQDIKVRYLAINKETGLTDLLLTPTSPLGVDGTPVAMTEIGSGLYQATFTPTSTGEWWVRVSSVLKPENVYAKAYEVGSDYNLFPAQETGNIADIEGRIGEVQTTPTINTVLGRLKALTDALTDYFETGNGKVKVHDGTTVADVKNLDFNPSGLNTLPGLISHGGYYPRVDEFPVVPAGTIAVPRINRDGLIETRSAVLTDEGSFYDTFAGNTLGEDWSIVLGTGASYAVADSRLTINCGTTADAETYLNRRVDYAPRKLKLRMQISQRIVNQDIYFGFSEAEDPAEMTSFARFHLTGTSATGIRCETQSSTDTNGNEGTTETFTVPSTSNFITFGIEIGLNGCVFTIGDSDDEATLICRRLKEYISIYADVFLRLRIKNGATAPASNTAITLEYAKVFNFNTVNVETEHRHSPLSIRNIEDDKTGYYAFSGNVAPGNNKHMISIFNGSGSGRRIRLKGCYINNMQESLIVAALIEYAFLHQTTAQSGGTTLTPVKTDSAGVSLPSQILIATGATVTGGSTVTKYLMSNDELKSDQDYPAPYITSLQNFIPHFPGMKELTLREGEGFSVQCLNNVTSGAFCFTLLFTVE